MKVKATPEAEFSFATVEPNQWWYSRERESMAISERKAAIRVGQRRYESA